MVAAQPHITADSEDKAITPIMGWSQDSTREKKVPPAQDSATSSGDRGGHCHVKVITAFSVGALAETVIVVWH